MSADLLELKIASANSQGKFLSELGKDEWDERERRLRKSKSISTDFFQ